MIANTSITLNTSFRLFIGMVVLIGLRNLILFLIKISVWFLRQPLEYMIVKATQELGLFLIHLFFFTKLYKTSRQFMS